ncbi:MAG: metal-sensitive transcriptional regulator [Candidatus Omnitrophica bacterium]|nr:metal-sensitive transcriptional regulator [Candidatus Omnitrophota bacterium]
MVTPKTTHAGQLAYLKKIEGQVRGLQKMIEEERYCVDILTQVTSVVGALTRVQNEIFKKHLESCVGGALKSGSEREVRDKIEEVVGLIARFRKG